MTHYLDTSAFVAWFDPHNPHCRPVLAWREKEKGAVTPAYNRMVQLEARHYLSRLTHSHSGLAWNAFRAFEGRRLFDWVKLDFSTLFELCEDLSRSHKPKLQCGFWDLCHIAAARKVGLPFVTCDVRQSEAAQVIGIKTTLIQ